MTFLWVNCTGKHSFSSAQLCFKQRENTNTIKQGLGWQLYDWTYHVLHNANAKKAYIEFKRLIYLEPEEIEQLLKSLILMVQIVEQVYKNLKLEKEEQY